MEVAAAERRKEARYVVKLVKSRHCLTGETRTIRVPDWQSCVRWWQTQAGRQAGRQKRRELLLPRYI